MEELIALRQFDVLYVVLDIIFLMVLIYLLIRSKKYMTIIIGLLAGVLYMIVDYGIFHLLLGTREIFNGYSMFWTLLWMSMSYGFTNFTLIWLWLNKDKRLFEWAFLIFAWWFCAPLISQTFSSGLDPIIIQRTTSSYHGYMAILLFVGYLLIVGWNLKQSKEYRINILWLLIIGVLVQFGWEAGLLLGGIRSAGFDSIADALYTLSVNSLLETNLGMPYIFLIFIVVTRVRTEQLKKRQFPVSMLGRIKEVNMIKPFKTITGDDNSQCIVGEEK